MYKKNTTKRFNELEKIKEELISDRVLPLYKYRTKNKYLPVIGDGRVDAKIMFVGEAPGKKEAIRGVPFCGASGKFLDELLAHVGIKRSDVYITNIVKDRPQENRDPTPSEIASYAHYLDSQIEIIKPKIIATLGRFSMDYIIRKFGLEEKLEPISKLHGKVFDAKTSYAKIKIIPFYHPASALYNGSMREVLKKDFEVLRNV